jgi:hypothetical protein
MTPARPQFLSRLRRRSRSRVRSPAAEWKRTFWETPMERKLLLGSIMCDRLASAVRGSCRRRWDRTVERRMRVGSGGHHRETRKTACTRRRKRVGVKLKTRSTAKWKAVGSRELFEKRSAAVTSRFECFYNRTAERGVVVWGNLYRVFEESSLLNHARFRTWKAGNSRDVSLNCLFPDECDPRSKCVS